MNILDTYEQKNKSDRPPVSVTAALSKKFAKYYGTPTAFTQAVAWLSGGRITDPRQASMILLITAVVILLITGVVFLTVKKPQTPEPNPSNLPAGPADAAQRQNRR